MSLYIKYGNHTNSVHIWRKIKFNCTILDSPLNLSHQIDQKQLAKATKTHPIHLFFIEFVKLAHILLLLL